MSDFELAKEICSALDRAEQESRKNIYILKPDTIRKINELENLLCGTDFSIEFDRCTNSMEICLSGYVLDSQVEKLKRVFSTVDLFVIDATRDGKVCIEMKILNAAIIERRK